jgi:hypothetical protein
LISSNQSIQVKPTSYAKLTKITTLHFLYKIESARAVNNGNMGLRGALITGAAEKPPKLVATLPRVVSRMQTR